MSPKGDDDDGVHDHADHVYDEIDDVHDDDDEEAELDHYHDDDDDDETFVCHSTRITIFRMLMLLMMLMMLMMMLMRTKEEAKELVNICVGRPGRRQIRMTNGETLETRAIFKEQHTHKLHI